MLLPPTETDLITLALTVWAEARGEGLDGQRAVAWVIRTRWEHPGWWSRQRGDGIPDDTITAVCRDPCQFSCWSPDDPHYPRLFLPATRERLDYQLARKVGEDVMNAPPEADITGGADHYCTKAVARYTRWARGHKPIRVIGNHQFYRLGLGAGS